MQNQKNMLVQRYVKIIIIFIIFLNVSNTTTLARAESVHFRTVRKAVFQSKILRNTHIEYSRSLQDQRSIIEEVFDGLELPISSLDECSWPSIKCVDGFITELRLSASNSSSSPGTISDKLGLLSNMEVLFLCKYFCNSGNWFRI